MQAVQQKSLQLKEVITSALMSMMALMLGYLIGKSGLSAAMILIAIPFLLAFLSFIFINPRFGLLAVVHYSFIVNGLNRFLPSGIPFGLGADALLLITLIATVFKASREQGSRAGSWVFYLALVWLLYTVMEIFNPEANNKEAWFYAVRGYSLYEIMMIPLVLIWMGERKDLELFLKVIVIWAVIAAFYGFKQNLLGITPGEQKWLDEGGSITHFIHGRLRIFSFYSDAGQFGANMAHIALMCLIFATSSGTVQSRKKWYWIAFGIIFWGYALSGSRGPLFVIIAGCALYLFLLGNFRILVLGGIIGGLVFGVLKYTHIGDGNYQIHRMRTALDPNDASLMVRVENQKKLKVYLASRPIGAGIGTGGSWGQRFYKGRWLSDVALDSWYVKIWVETGIIGLIIHLVHLLAVLFVGVFNTYRIRDQQLRTQMIAICAGYFGIIVASYGNQLFGQFPTGTIMYFSMVYMFICRKWDSTTPAEPIEKA